MRVATFNIRHGAEEAGSGFWGDPGAVAEACQELNADIIALQEVDRRTVRSRFQDMAALAASALGVNCVFAPTMRMLGGHYGNALLFRGELVEGYPPLELEGGYRYKVNALGRAWDIKHEPRNAILARLHIGGVALSVASTHLSKERTFAMQQLPRVLDALSALPGPHVLLGDLNTPYAAVKNIDIPDGFGFAKVPAGIPASAPRRAIDHIAVNGFGVSSIEAMHMPISDHRAIIAEIQPSTSNY